MDRKIHLVRRDSEISGMPISLLDLIQHTNELGDNAIVGLRSHASEVVGKSPASEVLCYGTALIVEKERLKPRLASIEAVSGDDFPDKPRSPSYQIAAFHRFRGLRLSGAVVVQFPDKCCMLK
jgi:hypothetical protein